MANPECFDLSLVGPLIITNFQDDIDPSSVMESMHRATRIAMESTYRVPGGEKVEDTGTKGAVFSCVMRVLCRLELIAFQSHLTLISVGFDEVSSLDMPFHV